MRFQVPTSHPRSPSVCLRPLVMVLLLASGASSWAQSTPGAPPPGAIPSGEQLKEGQAAVRPHADQAVDLPASPSFPRELGKPQDDITLDVSGYRIDGLDDVPRDVLAKVTAPYTGKSQSYEQLVDAAAAVTRFMQKELGYYLGYAYLPEQRPQDGVVRIAVMEGRLDQVVLNWPDKMLVNREVVERYLARLRPGEILRVRDVERVVFTVNDLYGIRARFEVRAGRLPGTATLVVSPQAEPRVTGKVELDANGSRYSGEYRWGLSTAVASPLGRGDSLSVNALASFNGGLGFGLVSYVMPVGANGLKLGTSVSKVHYQLDREIFTLDLNGEALAANGFGLYPLVRSRNLNVFNLVTLEHKSFTDRQAGLEANKRSNNVQVGLVGDFRDNVLTGGVNTYELSLTRGKVNTEATGTGNPAQFGKWGLGYSRLQNLISNRLLLYVRYKGQIAKDNLDNTERFSLGGPSGVRAFAAGEATADSGHLLTAELRFLPLESWFGRTSREMVFSAFYDWGRARYRHDPATDPNTATDSYVNTTTLSGWGLGAIWDRPGSFGLRVNLAWELSGTAVNDPVKRTPRAYAVMSKYF